MCPRAFCPRRTRSPSPGQRRSPPVHHITWVHTEVQRTLAGPVLPALAQKGVGASLGWTLVTEPTPGSAKRFPLSSPATRTQPPAPLFLPADPLEEAAADSSPQTAANSAAELLKQGAGQSRLRSSPWSRAAAGSGRTPPPGLSFCVFGDALRVWLVGGPCLRVQMPLRHRQEQVQRDVPSPVSGLGVGQRRDGGTGPGGGGVSGHEA